MVRRFPRWQIGSVTVTRVIEAEGLRAPEYMFRELTSDMVQQQDWLKPDFATDSGQLISSIHAFVIDDGHRHVIVDTCVGNDKVRLMPRWNLLQTGFLKDLAEAGYPAETIDIVLCTHLHVDHVGWNTRLVDGRWVPTFPNARYLFGRTEWKHWSRPPDPSLTGDAPSEVAQNVMEASAVYEDSIQPIVDAGLHDLVESNHRLSEAIFLEPTPGHSPGHVSVRISSDGEEAMITGDLIHHPIQCAMPELSSNFDWNVIQAQATRLEFLKHVGGSRILILGTHFATPTAGWIEAESDSWRFVKHQSNEDG